MLYELPVFQHVDAKSVKEAVSCLHSNGEKAKVIAGGTDLLALMKDRVEGPRLKIPEVLVNIKAIPEISRVSYEPGAGLRVGSAVLLVQMETSEVVKKEFPILAQAAGQVGTTQLRNMGTIGGNICQRPRCMYFRHPHFPCYKKGGTQCYAAAGEHRHYHSILKNGRCVMACPSDTAPALVALQAKAVIYGHAGERVVSIRDLFQAAGPFTETALQADEFLTEIQVPDQSGSRQVFLKHRIRHSTDFALASAAVVVRMAGDVCADIRIVLGGIAPFPYEAAKAEEVLKGKKLSETLISQAAEASVEGARPLPMNGYKIDLTRVLVRRVLTSIQGEAPGPNRR